MISRCHNINSIFKIFIISSLIFITALSSNDDRRIADELASPVSEIPLKSAMGERAYSDAVNSGRYSFVSNSKCRLCHRTFFIGRKNDPHDYAMDSLTSTGNEKDAHCLGCHSTGHGIPTGFVDMQTTPRLSNVQCEGCHGPGNVHIELAQDKTNNKTKKFSGGGFLAGKDNPDILKKMCTSCHTKRWNKSYHDLDKSYDSYKKADPNTRYK